VMCDTNVVILNIMGEGLEKAIAIITTIPFPCLCLVYLWIIWKLRCQRMDFLALLILGLYLLVLMTFFLVTLSPIDSESFVSLLFSLAGNNILWAIIYLFFFEMLRYKYIITVKDNSEYRKKERVINVLKYTFTILIGVFMIILVLIQYGQHENDEFFKKY